MKKSLILASVTAAVLFIVGCSNCCNPPCNPCNPCAQPAPCAPCHADLKGEG